VRKTHEVVRSTMSRQLAKSSHEEENDRTIPRDEEHGPTKEPSPGTSGVGAIVI
jgi:hypothetical protein